MIMVGQEKLLSEPVPSTRRERRAIKVFAIALVAVCLAAVAIAVDRGRSDVGCVSVSVPSYTGAVTARQCGAQARASCLTAYTTKTTDLLARGLRAACPKAGYPPPPPAAG